MKKLSLLPFLFIFLFSAFLPSILNAQELIQDDITTVKAKVIDIVDKKIKNVPGTDITSEYQTLKVEIISGTDTGKQVIVENDYLSLKKDEVFYLKITKRGEDGMVMYSVSEPYRINAILFFIILFVLLVLIFGGIQGIRGLVSLSGSLVLILYVLLPGILHGYSPIVISLAVSSLIIILGSYVTHGFNKTTTSAVIGMIFTVILTGALAYFAVHWSRLSGFSDEEAVYLNFDTRGSIDFVGLLLGGMLIGLLGVLYDVAIGQAISVEELNHVAPHLPRKTIFTRAVRIGREHIGALVNTLAIAYVGVSLPLLLLYVHSSNSPIGQTINREIFATEIIRTMIGSIGLVIAVPITTWIAVLILMRKNKGVDEKTLETEENAIKHFHHHH